MKTHILFHDVYSPVYSELKKWTFRFELDCTSYKVNIRDVTYYTVNIRDVTYYTVNIRDVTYYTVNI